MEEYGAEMCKRCGGDTFVAETRVNSHGVKWRRRVCKQCGYRYHTKEVYVDGKEEGDESFRT